MSMADKYRELIKKAAEQGFTQRISVGELQKLLMNGKFTVYQNSHIVFHIKSMETLGLIRQSDIPGIFEVVQNDKE